MNRKYILIKVFFPGLKVSKIKPLINDFLWFLLNQCVNNQQLLFDCDRDYVFIVYRLDWTGQWKVTIVVAKIILDTQH